LSYTGKVRLDHGTRFEQAFEDLFNKHPTICCEPFGQVLLPEHARQILRNAKVHIESDLAKEWVNQLPKSWREIYKRGMGKSLPSMSRWDPDFIIHENKQPIATAEIKSCIRPGPNASVEVSGILSAILNTKRLGILQVYVFPPWENKPYWSYTTLENLIESVIDVRTGSNTNGSGRPFVIVPKKRLALNFENVFFHDETTSTL
jgi:hypothetical protein